MYEEEIYGRGTKRGYWWSPDSSRVAFLRIDDTPCRRTSRVDDIPYDQNVETWEYPRAGDPNPIVRLGVARAAGGTTDWIDLSKYGRRSPVVRVDWAPDGRRSSTKSRIGRRSWLDLNAANVASSPISIRTLLRETSTYWINADDTTLPTWLKDGSFLWLSDRSGWSAPLSLRAPTARSSSR